MFFLTCMRASCAEPARAQAALAEALGGGMDVRLIPYKPGTVLISPELVDALKTKLGDVRAKAALELAGLQDAAEENIFGAVKWLIEHGEEWAESLQSEFSSVPDLGAEPWHLACCKVKTAWELAGGRDQIAWGQISVGQIDTGYTPHAAFGLPNSPFIKTALARTFIPGDLPGNGVDPLTGGNGGHGTGSGSLINAWDPAHNYFGVAPRVPIVPARINDCVVIDQRAAEFEQAVRYLVDVAKVSVINVSMGTFLRLTSPGPIQAAVDHAYERGVILVGAAGNVPVQGWPAFPGHLPKCIAVAGVTKASSRWFLSSFGDRVDFSAPADHVVLATAKGPRPYEVAFGGTTFAAAMTSGAAALWLQVHAAQLPQLYPEPWQRVEAFRMMARGTAHRPDGWTASLGLGTGVLDVAALMNAKALPPATALTQR